MKLILLLTLFSSFLFAHKLNVFLFESNEKIVANSYFASGSACRHCKIEVFDGNKKLLLSAQTNQDGDYVFDKLASKLIVKVEALGGHGASSTIEVENLAKEKKEISQSGSIFESLIAVILIALIFLGLKRFKK